MSDLHPIPPFARTLDPVQEMEAFEALWADRRVSFGKVAGWAERAGPIPSDVLREARQQAEQGLFGDLDAQEGGRSWLSAARDFLVSVARTFGFPVQLLAKREPRLLLYYRGDLSILEGADLVSIVGARDCSERGLKVAADLARAFADHGVVVASGLARGIDTAAMRAAMEAGGRTVGVIGTPITQTYPPENTDLQREVATDHLLVSHVPFRRYEALRFNMRRAVFLERNVTMALLSKATVIVEASDTSGTLRQARACLEHGRRLYIHEACFERGGITWPREMLDRGAVRINSADDVLEALGEEEHHEAR